MQVISSNLVSLNADSAISCSSALAFECHVRISTSNQQLMHRTKSRPTFFFSESVIFLEIFFTWMYKTIQKKRSSNHCKFKIPEELVLKVLNAILLTCVLSAPHLYLSLSLWVSGTVSLLSTKQILFLLLLS